MKWECVAVTLDEVREFLAPIQKTKDSNEKILRDQIQDHLVPILEKQEESRKRKQLAREKELLNLEKLAHAKRSSRIAGRLEQQKHEEQARDEERKRIEEEAARRKEESKRLKMEQEREKRLMSREQRLRERETRRLQHEEELAHLSEDSKSAGPGPGRMSERRRLAEIERNKQALKEIEEEEEDWIFDCVCGVYGQVDDGTHSVACERCNVWQHSNCLGIAEEEAEKDDFHFICSPCQSREQEAKDRKPRIIKIKVNRPEDASSSPPQKSAEPSAPVPQPSAQLVVEIEQKPPSETPCLNGSRHDAGETPKNGSVAEKSDPGSAELPNGTSRADDRSKAILPIGRDNNPFSSPHPNLSPPRWSPPSAPIDKSTTIAKMLQSGDGDRASLTANGGGRSPSKQSQPATSPPLTKTSPVLSHETNATILPHFTPRSNPVASHSGTPLPPLQGGLSPTKHSSPPVHANGSFSSSFGTPLPRVSSTASVFPPSAALSPSPQPQILTPPVKHVDPPVPVSQERH